MEKTQRRAHMELVAYDTCKNLNSYGKILIMLWARENTVTVIKYGPTDFAKITTLYPSLTAAYKVENKFWRF